MNSPVCVWCVWHRVDLGPPALNIQEDKAEEVLWASSHGSFDDNASRSFSRAESGTQPKRCWGGRRASPSAIIQPTPLSSSPKVDSLRKTVRKSFRGNIRGRDS